MADRQPDFSGWATKNDLVCSDGRIIKSGAFAHQDQITVPLVWQHQHSDPTNILGHAVLENRAFGVYTHGYFNDTEKAEHMKSAVQHGDIVSMSIYANKLTEKMTHKGKEVYHGDIKEVSLVTAGANPGAFIEFVNLAHSDDIDAEKDAVIYTGLALTHVDVGLSEEEETMADQNKSDDGEKTIEDVVNTMTEEQRKVLNYVVGAALEDAKDEDDDDVEHDDVLDGEEILAHISNTITHSIQEGINEMTHKNLFEEQGPAKKDTALSHDEFSALIKDAQKSGSLKDALEHGDYGIDDINLLFPEAREAGAMEVHSRQMGWVKDVLGGVRKSPFAKIKSTVWDITAEEARAKGYIKGNQKKDEVVALMRRTTGPTTIYKKQKLDRDDIIDITDVDVVSWLKAEIRLMLEEEIARAILFGDGRSASSEDKVKDPAGANSGDGIRSVVHDDDFYAIKVDLDANVQPKNAVKGLIRARTKYRGTGKPDLYVSDNFLTEIMLEEDKFGRPLYETEQVLADKLRVNRIVTVDIIDATEDLFAILVNLADYTVGTNKGGELTSFEDFDIDFNQHKYLMETRLSGALTKPFSAIVVRRSQGTSVDVVAPSFDGPTNTLTIPSVTGLVYRVDGEVASGDVVIDKDVEVTVSASEGYYIKPGATREWTYSYNG